MRIKRPREAPTSFAIGSWSCSVMMVPPISAAMRNQSAAISLHLSA
jgi:hypothetical protein